MLSAGFGLPRSGVDGRFGKETAAALTRFQQTLGLTVTGRLDDATLQALENAPSPSPEYDTLFADGVLRGVLAIGFDESGAHHAEISKVLQGLEGRGYRLPTAEERERLKLDPQGDYRLCDTSTSPGTVVLELITPGTPHAKDRFANALRRDELVLYGGHGRYGSGPDFDDIGSPAGNFVIGAPSELNHVTLGANDLDAAKLTQDYQLLFFDGCNTFRYLDDLRERTPGKTPKTLDVVGSTTELYWHVTADNLLTLLDGVTEGHSLKQLETALDDVNRADLSDQRRYFLGDGFEDNPRPR